MFANRPFLNIFGPQRFGSPLPINPEIGKRLLASDYRAAVLLLILSPLSDEVEAGLSLNLINQWIDAKNDPVESFKHIRQEWRKFYKKVSKLQYFINMIHTFTLPFLCVLPSFFLLQ